MKLIFGKANAKLIKLQQKLGKRLYTFSTLSGFNCPGAKDCQSFAIQENGKMHIQDGKHTLFRCFSASQEVIFPAVYKARKQNTELVALAAQDKNAAISAILSSLPANCEILRLHVAGDFKTQAYFDVWLEVCRQRPNVQFYAYTKSIPFWVKRLDTIPSNLILTASIGGKFDSIALAHKLRTAKVVGTELEAKKLKLKIDHDDYLAATPGPSFALLLHGPQPKGSKASKDWQALKVKGKAGYGQGHYFKKK
jgi:hypothetical protein